MTFTVAGKPDINGLANTWYLIAGTPWTLAYEWKFYFLLPVLVWFAKKPHRCVYLLCLFGLVLLVAHLFETTETESLTHLTTLISSLAGHLLFSFGVGILIASLRFRWKESSGFVRSSFVSVVGALSVVWIMGFYKVQFFDPVTSAVLGSVFLVITYGNTFWGLLTSRPLLLLGKCSYSLYLCHGLMLTSFVLLLSRYRTLSTITVSTAWFLIGVSSVLVFAVSLLCYTFIESRFLPSRIRLTYTLGELRRSGNVSPVEMEQTVGTSQNSRIGS
jgi:peptidoglycan/LPS O-acetylase OafA/YrhL